jgi:hypothetical protein
LPLLEQGSEISYLLLQCRDLSLQGVKSLWQGEERGGQRKRLVGMGCRWHLGQRSQAALMQVSQHRQVLTIHPFLAAIAGMAVQGELRIREPAAQRLGIDAQAMSSLDHRDNGHGITPFVCRRQRERERERA